MVLHAPISSPQGTQPVPADQAPGFIAINCHPFHDLDRVRVALHHNCREISSFSQNFGVSAQAVFFWHRVDALPGDIKNLLHASGISLQSHAHLSNGENLNIQIKEANKHSAAIFFRVDADDLVSRSRFWAQTDLLNSGTCDMCGTALKYLPDTGGHYFSHPREYPTNRDYLENAFLLHPTLAFRLKAWNAAGLRYGARRLEDKAMLRAAIGAGLRIRNLPIVGGTYHITKGTRSAFALKWHGFALNFLFLRQNNALLWLPYAAALFALQIIAGSDRLRVFRHLAQSWRSARKLPAPRKR